MSSEVSAVEKVLQVYFDGLYEGDTRKLGEVFHSASHLYAANGDGKPNCKKGESKDRATVPLAVREIAFARLRSDACLYVAKMTGDFNPIHWIPGAAHASGFRSVILHGFSTLARTIVLL